MNDTIDPGNPLPGIAILMVLFAVYWLPSIFAYRRHHRDKGSILLVNLFFGWTLIGWIIALIWAASGNVEEEISPHHVIVRFDSDDSRLILRPPESEDPRFIPRPTARLRGPQWDKED